MAVKVLSRSIKGKMCLQLLKTSNLTDLNIIKEKKEKGKKKKRKSAICATGIMYVWETVVILESSTLKILSEDIFKLSVLCSVKHVLSVFIRGDDCGLQSNTSKVFTRDIFISFRNLLHVGHGLWCRSSCDSTSFLSFKEYLVLFSKVYHSGFPFI